MLEDFFTFVNSKNKHLKFTMSSDKEKNELLGYLNNQGE